MNVRHLRVMILIIMAAPRHLSCSDESGFSSRVKEELTFQVLQVEVFKLPLDLAEQVHQVAPQRQRKLGVLRGSRRYARFKHTSCLRLRPLPLMNGLVRAGFKKAS